MKPSVLTPLDLSEFEISPEQGFLPQDPLEDLPDSPTRNHLGHELQKLLSARMIRRFIDEQRQLIRPFLPRGGIRTITLRCGF